MKFDGSLEVSGNSANNETDFGNVNGGTTNDHRGNTATRVREGVNLGITEGVSGRLELVRTPRLYGTAPTTVTTEQTLWTVQNAYAELGDLWGTTARLGRQYTGNNGDLVWHFGPKSDDSLTVTAIDGLLVKSNKDIADKVGWSVFTGKFAEDDTIATTDANDVTGDTNLSDLDIWINNVLPGGKITLGYAWGVNTSTASSANDNSLKIWRVGVNGGVRENMLTYRAEFLGNAGQVNGFVPTTGANREVKYKGTAIDLGLGFNPADTAVGNFSIWANWTKASGDDDATDNDNKAFTDFTALGVNTSDRYFGEIFGKSNTMGAGTPLGQGLAQVNGLDALNIGASWKPKMVAKTTVRLDYFMLKQSEDSVRTGPATTVNIGDKLGNEWDLAVDYAHTENVGITVGYAMFKPDNAVLVATGLAANDAAASALKDDSVTKLFARLNVKWGGEDK